MRRISADLADDERTGEHYYTVRVDVSEGEIARLGDLQIVPGMPVEAFIRTKDRTVLSYLFKPLTDHVMRTFRDG